MYESLSPVIVDYAAIFSIFVFVAVSIGNIIVANKPDKKDKTESIEKPQEGETGWT